MPRLFLALVLAGLLAAVVPGRVAASEPEWPANPAIHHVVFDTSGPDGQPGLWTWNESVFVGGDNCPSFWSPRWEWSSLGSQSASDPLAIGAPWPADVTNIHVIGGTKAGSAETGYLVWNPYRFVGTSGPTFWSPTWLWVSRGSKAQLTD